MYSKICKHILMALISATILLCCSKPDMEYLWECETVITVDTSNKVLSVIEFTERKIATESEIVRYEERSELRTCVCRKITEQE